MSNTVADYKTFDWDSVNPERDAVGADWKTQSIYIIKDFKAVRREEYEHFRISIPPIIFKTIWAEATSSMYEKFY